MMMKQKRGFSLVELAIGLAVITVLILTISLSSGIRDNARLQSAANSVQALRSAAESYIATGKLNYKSLDFKILKEKNILPSTFAEGSTNPWGGDYNIAENASDPTRFDVALTSVAAVDAARMTAYFNNIANGSAYDAGNKTWTVTF